MVHRPRQINVNNYRFRVAKNFFDILWNYMRVVKYGLRTKKKILPIFFAFHTYG